MKEITLNQSEFLLFDEFDQFGFFYDADGFPTPDAHQKFGPNVADLFSKYDYIRVDAQDDIYGVKGGERKLLWRNAIDAYAIALEVKAG
jgi:hypothetical protein